MPPTFPDCNQVGPAMKTLYIILVICIFSAVFSGCALQEDIIILEERLIVLERQNQALQKKNESLQKKLENELVKLGQTSQQSEKNLRTNYASVNVTLDNVQQEISALNGRIEELDYYINQQTSQAEPISKKVDDISVSMAKIENRMVQLEQYLNFEEGQKPAATKPAAGGKAPAKASSSDLKMYEDAKAAYDNGDFAKARQGFALLIKNFPKSEHADNAQFWIGESYYREKWYEKAILEYQTVLEKYPKGNKVPSAMLKQGLAFLQLGDKSNARLILKELQKNHPNSNEARIATQKLKEF
jgi:tol-pal system protein YbgF